MKCPVSCTKKVYAYYLLPILNSDLNLTDRVDKRNFEIKIHLLK